MELNKIKGAYFLGIGGIGMSAIARYLVGKGVKVWGYDRVKTALSQELEKEGMAIHYSDEAGLIPSEFVENKDEYISIYTPAIPQDFGELIFLKEKGGQLYKRSQILGFITQNSFTIAVAGTHGKTTTSCLLTKALSAFDINFTAFLGGISSDFGSNLVSVSNKKELLEKPLIVVEADEFDRSFLTLNPDIAIVTSTDADHLDVYEKDSGVREGFEAFANCIKPGGFLIQKKELELPVPKGVKSFSYGQKYSIADYTYNKAYFSFNKFVFTWQGPNQGLKVKIGIAGEHNAENATAVLALIDRMKLDVEIAARKLTHFKGVKRRFEKIFESDQSLVIDDYAHHPTELKAFIGSVKKMFPETKITGIFQPHLFSRTRDFMDGFAESLNLLDECWLMDIYPAREKPIEGISSAELAKKINACEGVFSHAEILAKINDNPPRLLLIMGAGDIDKLPKEVTSIYENKKVTA